MSEENAVAVPEVDPTLPQMKDLSTPKFNRDAADRLDSAIAKLIVFKPIFGTVFIYLNKKQVYDMPTMGVGIIRRVDLALFYNPDFVMKMSTTELRAVLQHEALHILLHHITRSGHFSYNKQGFNIAADMAINCHLSGLPDKCFYPKTFGLPDFESSEWYYESLKKEAEKQGKSGAGELGEGKGNLVDDHQGWGDCEDDVVKEKIKSIAAKGIKAQEQKGWSDIGSGLAQSIIEANKATINWKREVRYFINKLILAGRKTTRSRINRREQAGKKDRTDGLRDVYLQPGNKRDFKSKLLVALDTSGSVSDTELQAFVSEINGLVGAAIECHVIMFDTQLCCEPFLIKKRISNLIVKGRGGTDFEPPIRLAERGGYDGLIMFTDMGCSFPQQEKLGLKILWCASPPGHNSIPPYGRLVPVEIKAK